MRFPRFTPVFLSAAMALPAMVQSAQAQPQVLAAPQQAPSERTVRLKNVPAPLMASLLDPEHQAEPLVFLTSRANSEAMGRDVKRQMLSGFDVPDLPHGVSIEVDGAQNTLALRGPAAALNVWEKVIRALDKPLLQIEVEMQMVVLSPEALKAIGVPQDALGPHRLADGTSRTLAQLVGVRQAKVVSAPRVTAIAGLAASLASTTSTPVVGQAVPSFFYASNLAEPAERTASLFYIQQSLGMAVRPDLRADGSIDMEMRAGYSWAAQAQGDATVPLRRAQSFAFRAQDGASYLLYARPGFEPPAPNAAVTGATPDAKGQVAAFIVTARVVKRAPIEDAAPQIAAAK